MQRWKNYRTLSAIIAPIFFYVSSRDYRAIKKYHSIGIVMGDYFLGVSLTTLIEKMIST